MADCEETLRELEQYLDGEVGQGVRVAISAHLQTCRGCHTEYELHTELRAVIRTKCTTDELPPGLLARLERCFQEDFDGDGRIG